jgi:histidine ammonia-lyase
VHGEGFDGLTISPPVELDGTGLSIERLCALAADSAAVTLSADAWQRIRRGRSIAERALADGESIYGTTTGVGSQKDTAVGAGGIDRFGDRTIISEATDYPGPAFAPGVVRAALIVLLNNMATGRTGVRAQLVERLLALYGTGRLPTVRQDTANGIADLTPLSQLSLAVLGLALHGDEPIFPMRFHLAPKEAVSLINNNAFALAHGAAVLVDAERLLGAFDLAGAMSLEGLRGGVIAQTGSAAGGFRGPGQELSRARVLGALQGSALYQPGAARFLQDPMSFRCISQINGAAYDAWLWAKSHFEAEINSASDNPLVDLELGQLITSGCMASLSPVLSMDTLRQALAKTAVQSFERGLRLQSPPFSGLPVGLAADGAPDGGVVATNLHYIGSARLGTLTAAAAPVLLNYAGHMSDSVEDITSLTPLSVAQTATVVARAWELAALELTVGVWAVNRRGLDPALLGRGPRQVYSTIRPLLPIGEEGTRLIDMTPIIHAVRSGGLLERAGVAR